MAAARHNSQFGLHFDTQPPQPHLPCVAVTARAALDLSTSMRNLKDHARLFGNTYAALRGKLAIVGHIIDRGKLIECMLCS